MGNFYKEKKAAYKRIKSIISSLPKEEEITLSALYLDLLEQYEISKNAIKEYLDLLELNGRIKIKSNSIISLENDDQTTG